ncbi:MAG: alpha/beta hydrolase [Devosia sp.]|uniref:alpha/beta fold hydrolase n=1 Tax=Devosia sp. TaxID=1871048 RepID=UPI00261350AC|nr:alpha/beta hydrolase [Devosia sp.]MDB5539493.1 alpha/beta hydrolase [Devosia sp.]
MKAVDTILHTKNARICVRQSAGTGMPVLLLHGSGSSKDVFAKQFAHPMADNYHLIALDLPGHGESSDADDPKTAYTLGGFADTVGEVLDQLGVRHAAVFGWSLGGHIAIELLHANPAVAGLMLTGAPPVSHGMLAMLRGFHTGWDLLLTSKGAFTPRDVERFGRLCYGDNVEPAFLDAIRRSDGRVRTTVFKGLMRGEGADQKRVVEEAVVPIAMVNGANEPFARLGYVDSLSYRTLWHEHCEVIPGAAHAPFLEAPDVFNPLFETFVADVGRHSAAAENRARGARSA